MMMRRRRHRRPKHCTFSIYDPIPFGIDENGQSVNVTLMYRNLLAGGEPGSGKSSLLNTIIAHAALCSDVKLWLFDGKIVELGLWRPIADVFVGNDIREALTRLLEPVYYTHHRAHDTRHDLV
jgi:S-DNA-T family DNA segregation ATPase FtsK/SpoIIIE